MGPTPDRRGEEGIALIIAVLMLLLISGIGIAAIEHAGEDAVLTGRGRSASASLYAADAGIEFARNQIGQANPNTDPFNLTLPNGTTVRTGTKADGAPTPIAQSGVGAPPEGYSINVGQGYASRLYTAAVTSNSPGSAVTELEAKLSRFESARAY